MLKFLLNLFFISFLLNFVWEISQMGFYSQLGMGDISDYWSFVSIHWQVSLKDTLMVILAYLIIGAILRNWAWIKNWNSGWLILWVSLPAWQAIIEYYSVHIYGRWGYAETMPLIFGIGAIPLLQMLLLPSIGILLSRHLLENAEN